MQFKGQNVFITGASRGIGKATAIAFAKEGAHVGLNYKSQVDKAEATLAELPNTGHKLFKGDISKTQEAKALIDEFSKTYGSIDVLVNNAGISIEHNIDEVDYENWITAWTTTFNTNLFAAANLCYLATQQMKSTGGGRIINVTSRGAFRGEPNHPAYGASKAALNALSQSLAKKLAPHRIYVGAVAPGFTETDMATEVLSPAQKHEMLQETPFRRMAKPEEVAHAILFLASENAAYSSGTIIDVNGASYLRS